MKYFLISLVILVFTNCNPNHENHIQTKSDTKKEIQLIRSAHRYGNNIPEDFQKTIDEVINFKPELFFTETIPADDKIGISMYYEYDNHFIAHLLGKKNLQTRFVEEEVEKYRSIVKSFPDSLEARAHLIHALFLQCDRGDSEYQTHLFKQKYDAIKDSVEQNELAAYIQENLMSMDSFWRFGGTNRRGEYHLIAYPAAEQLGLERVFGMDNQDDGYIFSKHWNACADGYDSPQSKAWDVKYDSIEQVYRERGELLKYYNTVKYDEVDYWIYEIPLRYSKQKKDAKLYAHYWAVRNRKMVENMVRTMDEQGVQRATVIVGASHGRLFKKFLEEKDIVVSSVYDGELDAELKEIVWLND